MKAIIDRDKCCSSVGCLGPVERGKNNGTTSPSEVHQKGFVDKTKVHVKRKRISLWGVQCHVICSGKPRAARNDVSTYSDWVTRGAKSHRGDFHWHPVFWRQVLAKSAKRTTWCGLLGISFWCRCGVAAMK